MSDSALQPDDPAARRSCALLPERHACTAIAAPDAPLSLRMQNHFAAVTAVSWALVALTGVSQPPQAAGQGRPVEQLAVFEGTWAREGAPPGEVREVCSWFPGGRRHLVCEAAGEVGGRPMRSLRIYSYRNPAFTVYAVISDAPAMRYTGGPEGNRWVFNFQSDRPDDSRKARTVVTATKDRLHIIEEASENDGPWKKTEDYAMVRVK